MKLRLRKKGFTLIELLIVVVIIAILAALILPRLLGQPEKAVIAEAYQYLGVIRRAQESESAPNQTDYLTIAKVSPDGSNDQWEALGLSKLPTGSRFSYECTGGTFDSDTPTCKATRIGGTKEGATITMRLKDGQTTDCGGPDSSHSYQTVGSGATARCA